MSHSNEKVSNTDKVISETPLTVIWVSSNNIEAVKAVDSQLAIKLTSWIKNLKQKPFIV